MASNVDLDRMDKKALASVRPFIAAIEDGRTRVTLLYKEDYELIINLLKSAGVDKIDPKLCTKEYWDEYDSDKGKCELRFSLEKFVRANKKRRKGQYLSKYKLSKMLSCNRNHKCEKLNHVCRPVSTKLTHGNFACLCRHPSDKIGNFRWDS